MKSIVIPAYNEEDLIEIVHERLQPFLAGNDEVVFVNDGSTDQTARNIRSLIERDDRIRLINFSRNFGHQPAVAAGLLHARGDAVIVMDCDMQDPPELIPQMVEKWRQGYDVVHCVRRNRKENAFKRIGYSMFYKMYTRMTEFPSQIDSGDFSLMSRRVVGEINRMGECAKFVRGLRAFVGFKQTTISYDRPARQAGKTKYTTARLFAMALDGLFSFTTIPLRMLSLSGLVLTLVSAVAIVVQIYQKLFGEMLTGTATTYVLILFFGGLNLLCFGVLGEYIGKIFYETKKRPPFIIESVVDRQVCDE